MIVIDRPWEDLVVLTKCKDCGRVLVVFKDDLITTETRHDDLPIPMINEDSYATCPVCGEIVFHETNTKFEEGK